MSLEDLAHEALATMYETLLTNPDASDDVLYQRADNHCRTLVRRERKRQARHERLPADIKGEEDPARLVVSQDWRDFVCRHLPEELALVVIMHYWHGLSLDAIAAVRQVRQRVVDYQLVKARRILRQVIGERLDTLPEIPESGRLWYDSPSVEDEGG